jgi:pre-mRNA-processing factor 40
VTLTRHLLQRTRRSPPPREHSPAPVRDRSHRTRVSPAPAPTPALAPALAPAPVKEDPAVQSGSEEGEIEE